MWCFYATFTDKIPMYSQTGDFFWYIQPKNLTYFCPCASFWRSGLCAEDPDSKGERESVWECEPVPVRAGESAVCRFGLPQFIPM